MGYRDREIEVKLEVIGQKSIEEIAQEVGETFKTSRAPVYGISKDVYFKAPYAKGYSAFARVRHMPEGEKKPSQITVKICDNKSGNLDRIEADCDVHSANQATVVFTYLLKKPAGEVVKEYWVWFLEDDEHTTVSVYRVIGDKKNRVFVEIEAKTRREVMALWKKLEKNASFRMKRVKENLFQLFVIKRGQLRKKAK